MESQRGKQAEVIQSFIIYMTNSEDLQKVEK